MEQVPSSEENALSNRIEELFEADQKDRESTGEKTDIPALLERDRERRELVKNILAEVDTERLSAEDLYHIAMLFQHGAEPNDYMKAKEYAEKAAEGGHPRALWLVAAAEDRHLLSIGEKQKWGTQFEREANEQGVHELLPMMDDEESGATDEMRMKYGVSSREESSKGLEKEE